MYEYVRYTRQKTSHFILVHSRLMICFWCCRGRHNTKARPKGHSARCIECIESSADELGRTHSSQLAPWSYEYDVLNNVNSQPSTSTKISYSRSTSSHTDLRNVRRNDKWFTFLVVSLLCGTTQEKTSQDSRLADYQVRDTGYS